VRLFDPTVERSALSTGDRSLELRPSVSNPHVSVGFMMNTASLRTLDKDHLLRDFSALVAKDRRDTAAMLAYIAEIDRRKLYLEHACSSMFAFCVKRFRMSEAIAVKRIRGGRAASRFPSIFGMIACGELHLSGLHQLAAHLTDENHQEVLRRAKHRSMREIEKLVAELAPKPDVPSSLRALPMNSRPVPLSSKRYKLQVTIGEETRAKLAEVQDLLSHQIPDGDPARILDRALDVLLTETKKKKAALTDKPRVSRKKTSAKSRGIPARIRREVFERDEGRCAFVDSQGRRCDATWKVEFHRRTAYGRGGAHDLDNIELRCRGHNQYEADLEYGALFMAARRAS
jgi:hypothetical protein